MRIKTLDEVDGVRPGLPAEQKGTFFASYKLAHAAFHAAGFTDDDAHTRALGVASSRLDDVTRIVAVCDSIYTGEWPTPGKGAPRNPYGGLASVDYPDGFDSWKTAWRVYAASVTDPKEFLALYDWVYAVIDSGVYTNIWQELPNTNDIAVRDGKLPEGVKVYSTPADYDLKAWKDVPELYTELKVNVPSVADAVAIYEIVWSERKRIEVDGLFRADAAGPRLRVDSVDEVRVVRHDAETGTLTIELPIAKLTALPYRDESGATVFEAKRPEDFTTPRFLSSIPGKPVTQIHPAKHFHQVPDAPHLSVMTAEEGASRTFGVHHQSQDSVWVDGDRIWSRVTLFEPKLVQDVLLGTTREVSTGIVARVIDEEGELNGVHYSRRQVDPVYDHLAFVPRGRCGPECAALLDGAIQVDETKMEGKTMSKEDKAPDADETKSQVLRIGDAKDAPTIALCPKVTADDAAAFQTKIDAEATARKAAEANAVELQKKIDALQGANDGAEGRIKALEAQVGALKTTDDTLDARLDERLEMAAWMRGHVDDEYSPKGKSVVDMRKDALTALISGIDLKDKSPEYVAARFDALKDELAAPVGKNDLRGAAPKNDEGEAPSRRGSLWRDPTKKADKSA
jgi:hypothetical protein